VAASFASRESRLNQAVFAHLSNTDATLNSVAVSGIFDNANSLATVGAFGMASSQPTLTLSSALVPVNPVGMVAVVGGASYLVSAHEPDGTGLSRLLLELA
jgi:hypothetical protein